MQKLLFIAALLAVAGFYFWPTATIELPTERLGDEVLVETISNGEVVTLEDHLVAGRWTLFEYGADW